MNKILILLFTILIISCQGKEEKHTVNFPNVEILPKQKPKKEKLWVFILAGQSNMAGRAIVEPKDTIPSNQIFSINQNNQLVVAKEPLHFYEPSMTGLDLGMSFARELLKQTSDSISILLIPTAVGGSSIGQWLNNEEHRGVKLFSNFEEKLEVGETFGILKGVLWHQGESDATKQETIKNYDQNLSKLVSRIRNTSRNKSLPIIIGELGTYSKNSDQWRQINSKIRTFAISDSLIEVVTSKDLKDKGDNIHFDAGSIRLLGKRYADKFNEIEDKASAQQRLIANKRRRQKENN